MVKGQDMCVKEHAFLDFDGLGSGGLGSCDLGLASTFTISCAGGFALSIKRSARRWCSPGRRWSVCDSASQKSRFVVVGIRLAGSLASKTVVRGEYRQ